MKANLISLYAVIALFTVFGMNTANAFNIEYTALEAYIRSFAVVTNEHNTADNYEKFENDYPYGPINGFSLYANYGTAVSSFSAQYNFGAGDTFEINNSGFISEVPGGSNHPFFQTENLIFVFFMVPSDESSGVYILIKYGVFGDLNDIWQFSFITFDAGSRSTDSTKPQYGNWNSVPGRYYYDSVFLETNKIYGFVIEFNPQRAGDIDSSPEGIVYYSNNSYLQFEATTAVPEPATMLLLGSGFIGLVGYGRKKFFKK